MEIKARVPGTIKEINVKVGDAVKVKQVVGSMEAMKMTQPIPCPVDGTVKSVNVAVGDRVKSGVVLMVVE
jgi:biotin carboxyl carrier protein